MIDLKTALSNELTHANVQQVGEFISVSAKDVVCDFCSQPDASNTFYTDEEVVIIIDAKRKLVLSKDWAACNACAALVRADDRPGLLARTIKLTGAKSAEFLQTAFFRARR